MNTQTSATRATGLRRMRGFALFAFFAAAATTPFFAQQTAPAAAPKEEIVELTKFVTTGSRFNDRTVTQSPVPIDVISGRELTQGGYNETSQMIQAACCYGR